MHTTAVLVQEGSLKVDEFWFLGEVFCLIELKPY